MLLTNITIEELKALAKRMLDVEHALGCCAEVGVTPKMY